MNVTAHIAAPTPTPAQATGVRSGIANGMRAIGDGLQVASQYTGVAADRGYIFPVEGALTASKVLGQVTGPVRPVAGVVGKVSGLVGYLGAFEGMIMGGMVRTPGSTANDIIHTIADKIDGQHTVKGDFGVISFGA